jgi:hypothetical protein
MLVYMNDMTKAYITLFILFTDAINKLGPPIFPWTPHIQFSYRPRWASEAT